MIALKTIYGPIRSHTKLTISCWSNFQAKLRGLELDRPDNDKHRICYGECDIAAE